MNETNLIAETSGANKSISSWLVPVLLLLMGMIAIVASVSRLSSMTQVIASGGITEDSKDIVRYIEHTVISVLHLLPGIVFMLLGPFQFVPGIRRRWPLVHRCLGRVFIISGILVGISAISMAMLFPVLVNQFVTSANLVFGGVLIVALVIAFCAILRRDIARHRAWMIRAYAIGLSIATMRLMFGAVFLLSGDFKESYLPPLVWLTFILHIVVAELILMRKRRRHLEVRV